MVGSQFGLLGGQIGIGPPGVGACEIATEVKVGSQFGFFGGQIGIGPPAYANVPINPATRTIALRDRFIALPSFAGVSSGFIPV